MKTGLVHKILIMHFLLLYVLNAEADFYIDGGVSYRHMDNADGSGSSDTISTTDILVGYSDKVTLPLGLGHVKDSYNIHGKYRKATYSTFSELNYSEWLLSGNFRKYLHKRWWWLFSGEYLLVNTDNILGGLDRFSLGVESGYQLSRELTVMAGYRYRNTSYDGHDDTNISYGYSVGANYAFGEFWSVFARYYVDDDYIDSLGFFMPDTRIRTTQAGILLAVNEQSALRLMYEFIDDQRSSSRVFSTDFVLRY